MITMTPDQIARFWAKVDKSGDFVRRCVNPAHLRPATQGENQQNMRGALSNRTSELSLHPQRR